MQWQLETGVRWGVRDSLRRPSATVVIYDNVYIYRGQLCILRPLLHPLPRRVFRSLFWNTLLPCSFRNPLSPSSLFESLSPLIPFESLSLITLFEPPLSFKPFSIPLSFVWDLSLSLPYPALAELVLVS
jgi:hypothetical protein